MSQVSIPFRWIEPCLSCAQARGEESSTGCFLVADSVVLKALWSCGEFGGSHVLYPC